MKKPISFWCAPGNIFSAMVLLLLTALLSSCSASYSVSLTAEELQTLVNDRYMSPQIRKLEILPPFVNVQLYLETPSLRLRGDHQPLGFSFKGQLDADVFTEFVEGSVTGPVPFQLEGTANLEYRLDDHAFFFSDITLESAHIDLDIAMIQTLLIDQLKSAMKQELGTLPIIPLDESTEMYKKLKNLPVVIQVEQGQLIIRQKVSETVAKTN